MGDSKQRNIYEWLHFVETKIGTPEAVAAARVLKDFYEGAEHEVNAALDRADAEDAARFPESVENELPQEFNDWWNADKLTQTNPFKEDTPAYWAWDGWQAALASQASNVAAPFGYIATLTSPGGTLYHYSRVMRDKRDAEVCAKQWGNKEDAGVLALCTAAPSPAQAQPVADAASKAIDDLIRAWSPANRNDWDIQQERLRARQALEALLTQPPADAAPVEAKMELVRSGLSLMVELKKVKDEHAKVLEDVYSALLWLHRRLPAAYKPLASIDQTIENVGKAVGYDAREAIAERTAQPSPAQGDAEHMQVLRDRCNELEEANLKLLDRAQAAEAKGRAAGIAEAVHWLENAAHNSQNEKVGTVLQSAAAVVRTLTAQPGNAE